MQVSKKAEALTAENEQLRARLSALEQEIQEKEQEIHHFKNKIKISNIVDNPNPWKPLQTLHVELVVSF